MPPSSARGRPGTTVTVEGTVSSRFSQRTLRISESDAQSPVLPPTCRPPCPRDRRRRRSPFEGQRVRVSGTIIGAPDQLTDGLGVTLDDGIGHDPGGRRAGCRRAARASHPGWSRRSADRWVSATAPGTGTAGYRVHVTLPGELELAPAPTPSPVPTPTPTSDAYPDRDA